MQWGCITLDCCSSHVIWWYIKWLLTQFTKCAFVLYSIPWRLTSTRGLTMQPLYKMYGFLCWCRVDTCGRVRWAENGLAQQLSRLCFWTLETSISWGRSIIWERETEMCFAMLIFVDEWISQVAERKLNASLIIIRLQLINCRLSSKNAFAGYGRQMFHLSEYFKKLLWALTNRHFNKKINTFIGYKSND